jgi:hypothetical protein
MRSSRSAEDYVFTLTASHSLSLVIVAVAYAGRHAFEYSHMFRLF